MKARLLRGAGRASHSPKLLGRGRLGLRAQPGALLGLRRRELRVVLAQQLQRQVVVRGVLRPSISDLGQTMMEQGPLWVHNAQ